MNWEIFSIIGYVSVGMWLCMPLLWLIHSIRRPRGWFCHIALVVGVIAFVLAKVNSLTYVNRIQVDRSEEIQEQINRQELARQAALDARQNEVAQIRFAEDASDDFLDKAGMDESDLAYIRSFDDQETPEWKKEKKQRSAAVEDNSLEAQIGAVEEEQEGVTPDESFEEEEGPAPILMAEQDKLMADRFDSANLSVIRMLLWLGAAIVVVDYFRRANVYNEAYLPLPFPSSWANALTPREAVIVRPGKPRRSLADEMQVISQRGESFIYITDDSDKAAKAVTTQYRFVGLIGRVDVLNVAEHDQMHDDFVFETLWYGRNSFVVDSGERGERMLHRFVELLTERRAARARVRQAVNLIWDAASSMPDPLRQRLATLAHDTGLTLMICDD